MHVLPIIGGPKTQSKCDFGALTLVRIDALSFSKFPRGPSVSCPKGIVEPSDASKSRDMCNIRDRQLGLIQQTFRKVQSPRLCDCRGRRSNVLSEQATQVTNPDAEAIGEIAQ